MVFTIISHHRQRIGNSVRPRGVPDTGDSGFDATGDHEYLPPGIFPVISIFHKNKTIEKLLLKPNRKLS
jgi:hypothetical protein